MESLEQRVLLAGDMPAWQNPVLAEDVNGDAVVAPNDVLLIANELYRTGPRALLAPSQVGAASFTAAASETASTAGAEGEDTPPVFLDVNGDNYLTPADALQVVTRLLAEGQTDMVQLRFDVTDPSGTSIDSVDVGDSFQLNVFVQDIRPDTVPDRGVYSAFLDVFYDAPLISTSGAITFGEEYSFYDDYIDHSPPGEIQDVGNLVTDFGAGGPLGPGEFLFFTVPFTVDAAPIDAADDDASTDGVLNVGEDSPGVLVDVMANDTLGGPTEVWGAQAEDPPTPMTDVLVFHPPEPAVPPEDVIYGSDTLEVNSPSSLMITDVGPTTDGGTAVSASGGTRVEYTPPATANALGVGETATDSFDYTVSDGFGTATATGTVTIVGENDAPTAQNAGFGANEDTPLSDSLAPHASDPDSNDSLTFSGDISSTLGAAVTVNPDGTFTYDPTVSATLNALALGEGETDTFSYTVDDGNGGSDTAEVTITVDGLNDLPEAQDGSFGTDEDTLLPDTLANLASDPDTNDSLTFSGNTSSALGAAVTVNPDGTFTYDPRVSATLNALALGEGQTDTFSYTVDDGNGGSDTAEVTITVDGLNDPPEAQDGSFGTDEDTPLSDTLANLASDPDSNDSLNFSGDTSSALGAAVTVNPDGTFTYDPTVSDTLKGLTVLDAETDTFSYTVDDGNGGSDTAEVTITVDGLNDPPQAQDDDLFVDEQSIGNVLDVLSNDSDPDAGDTRTIIWVGEPEHGTATRAPDGLSIIYTPDSYAPDPGYIGLDTFSYTIEDSAGATATATVTVNVEALVLPRARNDTFSVGEDSQDNDLDV
ncbi:MAG: Ig-like domain-containing protein, partial [Planctomycetota bacterium]